VPEEFFEVFSYLKQNVRGADTVTFSVHCHNDLGMAVANSIAAVRGGARQVECTINGIGERAGNASLEEITMALKVREGVYGLHTGIDSKRLFPTSRLLSSITGMPIPRNKAVVASSVCA
jgi:2-isopropylmalate synthase